MLCRLPKKINQMSKPTSNVVNGGKIVNQSIVTLILQVDAVRSQCNDRINKLTSEVHALEMVSILFSINNVVLEK